MPDVDFCTRFEIGSLTIENRFVDSAAMEQMATERGGGNGQVG